MSDPRRTAALLPAQRLRRIRELAAERGVLTLRDAQSELGVSEMTARRDFIALERLGAVERTWGGVVTPRPFLSSRPHDGTEGSVEHAIVCAAAELISDGETIFLSGGSTGLALARVLARRQGITIVTTSLLALTELADNPNLTVLAVGGRVSPLRDDMIGPSALAELGRYRADVAFVAPSAIASDGVFNADLDRAPLDRVMIENASSTVLLADHAKLGSRAFALVTPLRATMTLVTDLAPSPFEQEWLRASGVRTVVLAHSEPSRRTALA